MTSLAGGVAPLGVCLEARDSPVLGSDGCRGARLDNALGRDSRRTRPRMLSGGLLTVARVAYSYPGLHSSAQASNSHLHPTPWAA